MTVPLRRTDPWIRGQNARLLLVAAEAPALPPAEPTCGGAAQSPQLRHASRKL